MRVSVKDQRAGSTVLRNIAFEDLSDLKFVLSKDRGNKLWKQEIKNLEGIDPLTQFIVAVVSPAHDSTGHIRLEYLPKSHG